MKQKKYFLELDTRFGLHWSFVFGLQSSGSCFLSEWLVGRLFDGLLVCSPHLINHTQNIQKHTKHTRKSPVVFKTEQARKRILKKQKLHVGM